MKTALLVGLLAVAALGSSFPASGNAECSPAQGGDCFGPTCL